ncbi:MAG: OmpA family protein [Phycisphaerae bacterium]|nr:OmpA family protein [Phycisphaerae bacterium]
MMMRATKWMILGLVAIVITTSGCQDWKKQYNLLRVEYDNLDANFTTLMAQNQECENNKEQYRQMLTNCQAELNKKPAVVAPGKSDLEKMGGVKDNLRGTITVTIGSNVLFSSGQVTLKSESKARLQQITSAIRRDYEGKEVWVVGHTDTDPIRKSKWKDNWELSTQRSLAVVRYLVENGISARNMVAAGRGQFHPVSNGGKAQNRRVEIVVYTR